MFFFFLESTQGPKTPIVPVTGLALAARVKIALSSGIASLAKLIE